MRNRVLYPVNCRCGKRTMNFFHPIGDFYIDECCKKAGYNHLGELISKPEESSLMERAKALSDGIMETQREVFENLASGEPKKRKKRTKKDEPST